MEWLHEAHLPLMDEAAAIRRSAREAPSVDDVDEEFALLLQEEAQNVLQEVTACLRAGYDKLASGRVKEALTEFDRFDIPYPEDMLRAAAPEAKRRGKPDETLTALYMGGATGEEVFLAAEALVGHRRFEEALRVYALEGQLPSEEKVREWEERLRRNEKTHEVPELRDAYEQFKLRRSLLDGELEIERMKDEDGT